MRPIVDGLQSEFFGQVEFVSLNARDGAAGEVAFMQLGLSGHPVVVLFDADGAEVYRGIGVIAAEAFRPMLNDAVEN